MDCGADTGPGSYAHGHAPLIWLKKQFPTAGKRLGMLARFNASAAMRFRDRRYSVFFEVRADLAWVARSMSGGGCCSPAIAHQTPL